MDAKKLYLNKPENVINLPEWMLSPETVQELRETRHTAVAEIAGRDSIAAVLKYVETHRIDTLVTTAGYTGTEYGEWEHINQAVTRLRDKLPGEIRITKPLILGSPAFWRALNGRFQGEIFSRLGFISPCLACHLYLHSIRIPLAKLINCKTIISGERESHDGRMKVNQTHEVLECYSRMASYFDIDLVFPLRFIEKGDTIVSILQMDWEENRSQMECVLSGNYRIAENPGSIKNEKNLFFLEKFALPLTIKVLEDYLEGKVPDHIKIGAGNLKVLL